MMLPCWTPKRLVVEFLQVPERLKAALMSYLAAGPLNHSSKNMFTGSRFVRLLALHSAGDLRFPITIIIHYK